MKEVQGIKQRHESALASLLLGVECWTAKVLANLLLGALNFSRVMILSMEGESAPKTLTKKGKLVGGQLMIGDIAKCHKAQRSREKVPKDTDSTDNKEN